MQNNLVQKGIVVGVILLFFDTSIVSSYSNLREDIHGAESDWGTLDVTIPKNRFFNIWWFTWLLERFPLLKQLLIILGGLIR